MFLVNGRRSGHLDLNDRAIHYGDGLFETVAVNGGEPLCWKQHMERLARGCAALGIPAPPASLLRAEAESLCDDLERGILKIVVSRGPGGRGYLPPESPAATRILGVYEWPASSPDNWRNGIVVQACRLRLGRQPLLAGIKHLNRLEQVLGRMELRAGVDEGLLLDTEGFIVEGTMSNLFVVSKGTLHTPDLEGAGVAGIIRALILERAPQWGLQAQVCRLTLADVLRADEAFFTNCIIGVWPAVRIESREFPVGPLSRTVGRNLAKENLVISPCDG